MLKQVNRYNYTYLKGKDRVFMLAKGISQAIYTIIPGVPSPIW